MAAGSLLTPPLDWSNETLQALRDALANGYNSADQARLAAMQAGIVPGTFPSGFQNMRVLWTQLCDTLAAQGRLAKLVENAAGDPMVAAYRVTFTIVLGGAGQPAGGTGPGDGDSVSEQPGAPAEAAWPIEDPEATAAVRALIEDGLSEEALDKLEPLLSNAPKGTRRELSVFRARFKRLERDRRRGELTRDEAYAEQTRLDADLLAFLDEIEP